MSVQSVPASRQTTLECTIAGVAPPLPAAPPTFLLGQISCWRLATATHLSNRSLKESTAGFLAMVRLIETLRERERESLHDPRATAER